MIGKHSKAGVFQRPCEVSCGGWGSIVNDGNLHAIIFARRYDTGLARAAHFRTSLLFPIPCAMIRLTAIAHTTVSNMSVEDGEWAVEHLPIVSERFPIEFANTRYLHGNATTDRRRQWKQVADRDAQPSCRQRTCLLTTLMAAGHNT